MYQQNKHRFLLGAGLVSFFCLFTATLPTLTWAGSRVTKAPQLLAQFKPPTQGTPGRLEGAGTRTASGPCIADVNKSLTLLMPESSMGLTLQSSPTFYAYLPQSSASKVDFILLTDEENNGGQSTQSSKKVVYEKSIEINGKMPGIIMVNLAEGNVKLEANKQYQWSFSLACGEGSDRSGDVAVSGIVQKVEAPDLKAVAETLQDERKQALFYADKGYWFDALNILAKKRFDNLTDEIAKKDWENLLTSVKLDKFAEDTPIKP